MDRLFSDVERFSLAPLGVLTLGGVAHDIPPLTRRRFVALVGYGLGQLRRAIAFAVVGTLPRRERDRYSSPLALFLAQFGAAAYEAMRRADEDDGASLLADLADVVADVVPGVTVEAWRAHATPESLRTVFDAFARGHDWAAIADQLSRDPEAEAEEPPVSDVAAMLAFARAYGITPEDLWEMRIEGFYALMQAGVELAQRARRRDDAGGDSLALGESRSDSVSGPLSSLAAVPGLGVATVSDPEAFARLEELTRLADARDAAAAIGGDRVG